MPLISMWMREQNISDLLRVTSKAVWSHTFPFSDFRVYSFLFHLQSTFNSFLEQSCSFLLGKLLAESVFASETDSLFIQTNRMFFIPIHSWALPLTLPALLPCPGGRGDGKAGPGRANVLVPKPSSLGFGEKSAPSGKKDQGAEGIN